MLVYIGLAAVSAFLVHTAGTWGYAFFIMLQQGEVSFYEPNRPYLMAEFGMAVVWTLLGFVFLAVALVGLKKKADKRRGE
jgi:hypothetical protein